MICNIQENNVTDFLNQLEAGPIEHKMVLDVGCGDGWWCNWIAEIGGSPFGIDKDEGSITQAKGNYPLLPFVAIDIDALIKYFSPMEYDIITLWNVLPEIKNQKIIVDLQKLMHPDGCILASVPSNYTLYPFNGEKYCLKDVLLIKWSKKDADTEVPKP